MGQFSMKERKSSKYRSASYRKMSSSEMWPLPESAPSIKAKPPTNSPASTDAAAPPAGKNSV
jgi:hypothetical protein